MELNSPREIIQKLGGVRAVADLTGSKYAAVLKWNSSTTFPSDTYLVLTAALKERGLNAPASLWRMVEPAS